MHELPDALNDATVPDDAEEGMADLTHQERTSAHREPMLLLDALALRYPNPGRHEPATGIEMRRTPDRCVLQSATAAVSVSWFAPRHGGIGELQIIAWNGTVTMPGGPRRTGQTATMDRVHVFHLTRTDGGKWGWRSEEREEQIYTSDELLALCERLLPRGGTGSH